MSSCYLRLHIYSAGDADIEDLTEALKVSPYGRCVYACDNDVVDHQVREMCNPELHCFFTTSFSLVTLDLSHN